MVNFRRIACSFRGGILRRGRFLLAFKTLVPAIRTRKMAAISQYAGV